MAVTILQSPADFTSGFNPQIFLASASDSYLSPYRYKIEVIIAGTTIATFVQVKRPNGNALFDAQRTIENYLSYLSSNLINGTKGWRNSPNNTFVKYRVKFTAQKLVAGVWTDNSSVTSNQKYAINSALNYKTYVDDNLQSRIIGLVAAKREWLTNIPNNVPIRIDERFELGIIRAVADSVKYLVVRTYDANNILLKTVKLFNSFTTTTNDTDKFLSILCGASDLNSSTLAVGSQPVIANNTAYYDVNIEDIFGGEIVVFTKRFIIDRSCVRSNIIRLFWLNPYGRFDAFSFTQVNDKSIEVEQSRYNKLLGAETTTTFEYEKSEFQQGSFFSEVKTSYKLRSGYISNSISEWLIELYSSPLVYALIDGVYQGVVLKSNQYQVKNTVKEKLFNVELDIQLSVANQLQRL